MKYISASEAKQEFALLIDSIQSEPVIVRRQKREVAVILSMQDYHKLTQASIQEFQNLCDEIGNKAKKAGLTEKKLAKILSKK